MGTRIARKLQKIFGINAGSTQKSVFGSLAAAAPAYSSDPVTIQSLANYLTGWFGAVIGGNSPAIEDMNALCYLFAYQLSYLLQMGIPEWDATTEYFIGNFAADGLGGYYQSLTDNNLGNALSDPVNWVQSTGPQRVGDFLVTQVARAESGFVSGITGAAGFQAENPGVAFEALRLNSNANWRTKRANGSLATPTALSNGQAVEYFETLGYDGTTYRDLFLEVVTVAAAVSAGIVPGKKDFYASKASTGSLTLAASIDELGITLKENSLADSDYGTIATVSMDTYYAGSFNYVFAANTGFAVAQTVQIIYTVMGFNVTFRVAAKTATADAVGQIYITGGASPIPVNLRPSDTVACPIQVTDNGNKQSGLLYIDTSGLIRIYSQTDEGGSFTAGATCGWAHTLSISYVR